MLFCETKGGLYRLYLNNQEKGIPPLSRSYGIAFLFGSRIIFWMA